MRNVFKLKLTLLLFVYVSLIVPAAAQQTSGNSQHHHEGHEQLGVDSFTGHSLFHLESTWVNHDGAAKTLAEALSGKPTVGAIIYTSCEHACPMIVNDMMKIERQLGDVAQAVQFTLFSMDYERDKPEKLKLYRNDKELGQWDLYVPEEPGSELELAIALGIRIKPLTNGEFAHSNVIFILHPDGTPVHQQVGLGLVPDESVVAIQQTLKD